MLFCTGGGGEVKEREMEREKDGGELCLSKKGPTMDRLIKYPF